MKREQLARARARKHWTLEQAARQVGVDANTLSRWELGKTTPHPYNVDRLCTVYGATAVALGLEDEHEDMSAEEGVCHPAEAQQPEDPSEALLTRLRSQDLTLRLLKIVLSWSRRNSRYDELQWLVVHETEDMTTMNPNPEDPMSRRDALRRLALLPLELCGLDALQVSVKSPPEEVLTQCAVGIVAYRYLSKGQYEDMALANRVISSYLPTLQGIVKGSSSSRQQAADLTAQAFLWKSTLSIHALGPRQAAHDAEQAAIYSQESGNLPLQLAILKQLSWIYYLSKQKKQALDKALQAKQLLQQPSQPLSPLVLGAAHSDLAKYQAQAGRNDDALIAHRHGLEIFSTSSDNDEGQMYVDFNYSTLIMNEGLMYYHIGQYDKAFEALTQAIDPETLTSKVPASSERVRIEIINHQALASLKRRKKDQELSIKLWKAGIQGAKVLKSEQRFAEANTAHEIMESLWGGDKPLNDLRDELNHW